MQLGYILQNLTYGELKQVGVGGHDAGAIQPENYIEVIGHINFAMQNLYSRFPLDEKDIQIETQVDKLIYSLTPAYALSNNPEGYLLDSVVEPFLGDILRITGLFNVFGCEVPLNDLNDPESATLPSYDRIKIPLRDEPEILTIVYRANPLLIEVPDDVSTLDLTQEVRIPYLLLEALQVYVSYRIYKGQGGEQGVALAENAKQHYKVLCAEIEDNNLLHNAQNSSNIKPELNGWV